MSDDQKRPDDNRARVARNGIIQSAVGDVVDVFRASPSLLMIMLLNIIFLGGLGYLLLGIGERRSTEFKYMMETMDRHYNEVMTMCFKQPPRESDH